MNRIEKEFHFFANLTLTGCEAADAARLIPQLMNMQSARTFAGVNMISGFSSQKYSSRQTQCESLNSQFLLAQSVLITVHFSPKIFFIGDQIFSLLKANTAKWDCFAGRENDEETLRAKLKIRNIDVKYLWTIRQEINSTEIPTDAKKKLLNQKTSWWKKKMMFSKSL